MKPTTVDYEHVFKGGRNPPVPTTKRPQPPSGSGGPRVGIAERPPFTGVPPDIEERPSQISDADRKLQEYPNADELMNKVHGRVKTFLYLVMRDASPTGAVAEIIQNITTDLQSEVPRLSNQNLEEMADRYADRLLSGI